MKKICIAVPSVTYGQKAKGLLDGIGISAFLLRKTKNTPSGCGWCVAVQESHVEEAKKHLRNNGVKLTGDIYDLP